MTAAGTRATAGSVEVGKTSVCGVGIVASSETVVELVSDGPSVGGTDTEATVVNVESCDAGVTVEVEVEASAVELFDRDVVDEISHGRRDAAVGTEEPFFVVDVDL